NDRGSVLRWDTYSSPPSGGDPRKLGEGDECRISAIQKSTLTPTLSLQGRGGRKLSPRILHTFIARSKITARNRKFSGGRQAPLMKSASSTLDFLHRGNACRGNHIHDYHEPTANG